MKSTCHRCHGQGRVITTPCRQCSGKGTVTRTQTVNVQIPAGVADGQRLRVPVAHSEVYVVLKVNREPFEQPEAAQPEVRLVKVTMFSYRSKRAIFLREMGLISTQMQRSASLKQFLEER